MKDSDKILILSAVVIVAGIYVLKYVLQKLFNKGTDAIGNARRKSLNSKNGAEVVRLADLYPEIAAMHREKGTDYAAAPALMTAAAGASATAETSTSRTTAPGSEMQVSEAAVSEVPVSVSPAGFDRIPEEPKEEKRRTGFKATVIFITALGILANLPFLIESVMGLIRHNRYFDSNKTVVNYNSYVYDIGILRGIIMLSLLSVAAYLILLFTKRIIYTFFYPALTFILSILFFLVLNRYAAFYGGDRFSPDRSMNVPENIRDAQNWATGVIFTILAIGIFLLIYFIKRKQWSLWGALLMGIFAVFCAVFAFGEISGWTEEQIILSCNYGGYPLLTLLYSLAYKEENSI